MPKLEAMLEQRGIASPREMSEALARCQLHGGDLTTSLLQFVSADETQLIAALSECYALPAAVVGLLPAPDDLAFRSLPREIAERYCCFPLEASPGRLVLAVGHPLEPALKEELGFALGMHIEERVAIEVRIRQALSRFYGLPLSARNQRGISRLDGDLDAALNETPLGLWSETNLSSLPRPPSELPLMRSDSPRLPSVRPQHRSDLPRVGVSSLPPSSGLRAARRRGPLSLEAAREELTRARSRNDVLDTFFSFASQFFEYSALFAVHNSLAEGLDASGPGAEREVVLAIGVPLDLPSSLSEAAESCKVRLTRLGTEGIDRTLSTDLRRQPGAKALVLPISLRGRCAVLLYADNGAADFGEPEIADVVTIAPDVANAIGRIILQRKKDAAQQKLPQDSADLSASLAPSRGPASSPQAGPSGIPGAEHEAEIAIPTLASKKRDRSRNNARSRPADPASPWAGTSEHAHPPPQAPGATQPRDSRDPERGRTGTEDPVFLLARPSGKPRSTPHPRDAVLHQVAKPAIAITRPAPLKASRPRLPSVIVDPEATDVQAAARLTRAAAITRAPSIVPAAASSRRAMLPPAAEAPRRIAAVSEPPAPGGATDSSIAARGGPSEPARSSDTSAADPSLASAARDSVPPAPRDSAPPMGQASPAADSAASAPPYAAAERAAAPSRPAPGPGNAARGRLTSPKSNSSWPPPIMDASPPVNRQPPLTALVPIIIAGSSSASSAGGSSSARNGPRGGARSHSESVATPIAPTPAIDVAAAPLAGGAINSAAAGPRPGKDPAAPNVAAAPLHIAAERGAAQSAPAWSQPAPAPARDSQPPEPRVAGSLSPSPKPPATRSARPPSASPPAPSPRPPAARQAAVPARSGPTRTSTSAGLAPVQLSAADNSEAPATAPVGGPVAAAAHVSVGRYSLRPEPRTERATASMAASSAPHVKGPSAPAAPGPTPKSALLSAAPHPAAPQPAVPQPAVPQPAVPQPAAPYSLSPSSGALRVGASPAAPQLVDATPPGASLASRPSQGPALDGASPGARPQPASSAAPTEGPSSQAGFLGSASSAAPTFQGSSSAGPVSHAPATAAPASQAPSSAPRSSGVPLAAPSSSREPASATRASQAPSSVPRSPGVPSAAPASHGPFSGPRSSAAPASAAPASAAPASAAPASAAPASAAPASARMSSEAPALASLGADRRAMPPPPPPSVTEMEELVNQVCQGNSKAAQEVARIGAATLPQLMARFPGPVVSERAGPNGRASESGPLLQALANIGSPATVDIARSSEDPDARVRRWATLLLGELPGPEACRAVVVRLADEVPRVHQAALDAARLLLDSSAANLFRKTLFEVAEAEDAPLTLRLRTLEHVAKLKDSASVPRLIAFLGADVEPIVHKALWALTVVTRNDFGRDARAWWDWWHSNQAKHRVEWLIEALDHRDPRLRKAAAEELQLETREAFGYAEDLARPLRLEAQKSYRKWWQSVGAPRYGRSA